MIFRPPSTDTVPRSVVHYLLPHERQVITVHRHPAVFAVHCSILAAACAAASLLTIITSIGGLVLSITWLACSVIFLWLVIRVIAWSESYFVVTNGRMLFVTGPVPRKALTVPMVEIRDLGFYRTIPGRLMGYGAFVVDQATHRYKIPSMNYMPYAEQLHLEIQGLWFSNDVDDSQELDPEDSL